MNKPDTLEQVNRGSEEAKSEEELNNRNFKSQPLSDPTTEAIRTAALAANVPTIQDDLPKDSDVSATDVVEAASNVTLATGLGGPVVQGAATAVAIGSASATLIKHIKANEAQESNSIEPQLEREKIDEKVTDEVDKSRSTASNIDSERPVHKKIAAEHVEDVFTPPASLTQRYLKVESRYHFRDDKAAVAFEDEGDKLVTQHNDAEVARSMVELAEAKMWSKLHLRGTDEFKREAWLEASMRGLETKGYKPHDIDLARLAELRLQRDAAPFNDPPTREEGKTFEQDRSVSEEDRLTAQQSTAIEALKAILKERGDSESQVAAALNLATERFNRDRVHIGKIVEQGSAHYKFDPDKEQSHFVRLATAQGEQMIWGIDLKRAIKDGGLQKGDDVAIAYQGREPVTLQIKDRDASGKVIGQREVTTHRNIWAAEKVGNLRADALEKITIVADRSGRQPVVKAFDPNAASQRPRPQPVAQRSRTNDLQR